MSLFGDLLSAGLDVVREIAGETVTYSRGSQSASVTATPAVGQQVIAGDPGSSQVEIDEQDFLIAAADLVLTEGGHATSPTKGDRIALESGEVWQVHYPSTGGRVFRAMDPAGTMLRIHTKRVNKG